MVLTLCPSLSVFGGVQASGRVAWEAISRATSNNGGARLVMYGERQAAQSRNIVTARSRMGAIVLALRARRTAGTVLVWHLDLVKLLPYVRRPGSRVFIYLHGIEAFRRLEWISRRALRAGDVFLSNSDYTWQRFVTANPAFGDAPHVTVPLGLNSPTFPVAPDGSPPAALMVGRLLRDEDYKGHREVIAAWKMVLEQLPGAELWIVGDGDLRPALEQDSRALGLGASIRFSGLVSDAEKDDLLRRCRCLVMPSAGEGFGLVYVEAMRAGRPCLVSTLDAGREVVNPPEAGLAVDPRRPRDVADAVVRLLTPGPEWDRWSEAGRARYASRYTREHFERGLVGALDLA
ncbi:MAG TPA: glycosyltransferase family 4 protein [Candidatus Acidoferrum sp.]|nr:glycosyltransferase family 4 protein [Candidatus Acidoferrum sp.]